MADLATELRAEFEAVKTAHAEASTTENRLLRRKHEAELAVLRAEGRGHTSHAAWLEAALDRRYDECTRIANSAEWRREERAWRGFPEEPEDPISSSARLALEADVEAMEAQP